MPNATWNLSVLITWLRSIHQTNPFKIVLLSYPYFHMKTMCQSFWTKMSFRRNSSSLTLALQLGNRIWTHYCPLPWGLVELPPHLVAFHCHFKITEHKTGYIHTHTNTKLWKIKGHILKKCLNHLICDRDTNMLPLHGRDQFERLRNARWGSACCCLPVFEWENRRKKKILWKNYSSNYWVIEHLVSRSWFQFHQEEWNGPANLFDPRYTA